MLYNNEIKETTLGALHSKVSSVVDICIALINEGYIPNRTKTIKLQWMCALIDGFENIDVMTVEQHNKLENLYNKIIDL